MIGYRVGDGEVLQVELGRFGAMGGPFFNRFRIRFRNLRFSSMSFYVVPFLRRAFESRGNRPFFPFRKDTSSGRNVVAARFGNGGDGVYVCVLSIGEKERGWR